jgi:hypothetical protein
VLLSDLSAAIANTVKDPLRGGLEAAERSLLQSIRNGSDHQNPA